MNATDTRTQLENEARFTDANERFGTPLARLDLDASHVRASARRFLCALNHDEGRDSLAVEHKDG